MMNKKFLGTFSVILIYITLILLYAFTSKRSYGCNYYSPCIRFCSSDTNEYSDKQLLTEFAKSKTAKRMDREELRIIRGAPNCGELKFWPPHEEKNDTNDVDDPDFYFPMAPYEYDYQGDFEIDGRDYTIDRYCLEKDESVYDGWKLMYCYQDYFVQKVFHVLTLIISITMIGFTLFVYSYFKELRDFNGKAIIALTGCQTLTYILVMFARHLTSNSGRYSTITFVIIFAFIASLGLTLQWITVMIFHSYMTFKNFKDNTFIPYEFSTYALFAISFSLFTGFVFVQESLDIRGGIDYIIFFYMFIGFVDFILLILTSIKIIITSRHLQHSEQARFDTEKKWFWIVLKLTLMMLATWPFEILIWNNREFHLFDETIKDLVNILTATSILFMLVGREKARILLFGKYRKVYDIADAE